MPALARRVAAQTGELLAFADLASRAEPHDRVRILPAPVAGRAQAGALTAAAAAAP